MSFQDRTEAGRMLGQALQEYSGAAVIVYALPRGGLPVAVEIAKALQAPLDLALVRKVGIPSYPELAMGAVIDGQTPAIVRNEEVIRAAGITEPLFQKCCQRELEEIRRRRRLYLGDRADPDLAGKTVIIVDDGLATGATARAAVIGLRKRHPRKIVLAVPVASVEALDTLRKEADAVVCLEVPADFRAVGQYYQQFPQLSDQDVLDALEEVNTLKGPDPESPQRN